MLDEGDRMLDLGFIRDIRAIVAALPAKRQSMLFSATMPGPIEQLAKAFLRDPVRVEVTPEVRTPEKIEQSVHFVQASAKYGLLSTLLEEPGFDRVIVFTRTKRGANRVTEYLDGKHIPAEALHGNKSQSAREKSLDRFRSGRARVLVATDIASRGIDVKGISHVINFDLPVEPESYVHRIGRTARAGATGIAISFCDSSEHSALRAIERTAGVKLRAVGDAPPPGQRDAPKPDAQRNRRPFRRAANDRGRQAA